MQIPQLDDHHVLSGTQPTIFYKILWIYVDWGFDPENDSLLHDI